MSNRPDIKFAREMIKHHEAAVRMSKSFLLSGNHPFTRRLAMRIIKAQTIEIGALRRFLEREARHDH